MKAEGQSSEGQVVEMLRLIKFCRRIIVDENASRVEKQLQRAKTENYGVGIRDENGPIFRPGPSRPVEDLGTASRGPLGN